MSGNTPARLLRALAARYGRVDPLETRSTPWASVTFAGTVHRILLDVAPDVAAAIVPGIADEELPMRGGFVADIAAVAEPAGERVRVRIEALVIDDG